VNEGRGGGGGGLRQEKSLSPRKVPSPSSSERKKKTVTRKILTALQAKMLTSSRGGRSFGEKRKPQEVKGGWAVLTFEVLGPPSTEGLLGGSSWLLSPIRDLFRKGGSLVNTLLPKEEGPSSPPHNNNGVPKEVCGRGSVGENRLLRPRTKGSGNTVVALPVSFA